MAEKTDGSPAVSRAQVYIRLKPPSLDDGIARCVEADGNRTLRICGDVARAVTDTPSDVVNGLPDTSERREFRYDGIFVSTATQSDIFMTVGLPILRSCLKGINGTILAYGQTGSGKTYSLLRSGGNGESEEEVGVLGWVVATLFVHVAHDSKSNYTIEASALQVYNEQVDDLMHPKYNEGGGHNLQVQNGGAVPGQTWVRCVSADRLLDVFLGARSNLTYAETELNKAASRSHAMFQIRITRSSKDKTGQSTTSRLSVVDLAGSERVFGKRPRNDSAASLRETTCINKSLLALGNTMHALATKQRYVPIRDSKLTRILDGSIGGSCQTSLLICVSVAISNANETLRSLEFASRALDVEIEPKVNFTPKINLTDTGIWNSRPTSPERQIWNSRPTSPERQASPIASTTASERQTSSERKQRPSKTEVGGRLRSNMGSNNLHSPDSKARAEIGRTQQANFVDSKTKALMSDIGRVQQGNSSSSSSLPDAKPRRSASGNGRLKYPLPSQDLQQTRQPTRQPQQEVFEIRFPGTTWPPPANFETELLRALAACWAIKLRDIAPPVIRNADGAMIAEFSGSAKVIQELSRLPLHYLRDLIPNLEVEDVEAVCRPVRKGFDEEERPLAAKWQARAVAAELKMKALEKRAAEAEARAEAMEKALPQTLPGSAQPSFVTLTPPITPPIPKQGESSISSFRNKDLKANSGSPTPSSWDAWMDKQYAEHAAEVELLQKRHTAEVSHFQKELSQQKADFHLVRKLQKEARSCPSGDSSEDTETSGRVISANFKMQAPETSHTRAFQARACASRADLEERLANIEHLNGLSRAAHDRKRGSPLSTDREVPEENSQDKLDLDAVLQDSHYLKHLGVSLSGATDSKLDEAVAGEQRIDDELALTFAELMQKITSAN